MGEGGFVIKVGKTSRNVLKRSDEQKPKGYVLLKYWRIELEHLAQCEKFLIRAFRERYGDPIEGREAFSVDDIEAAVEMAHLELGEYVVFTASAE
ncbi:MAG: hypothetical protein RPV21_03140 [Candidatus Sedimenticola sp. (ex Thyasira tokunagai)]